MDRMNRVTANEHFCQALCQVVRSIPVGKVTTYGEIARLLGYPQAARLVGRTLKLLPAERLLPAHRVVNAAGRLVPGWEQQRLLLACEGVTFLRNGNVDLIQHLWCYEELGAQSNG